MEDDVKKISEVTLTSHLRLIRYDEVVVGRFLYNTLDLQKPTRHSRLVMDDLPRHGQAFRVHQTHKDGDDVAIQLLKGAD